MKHIGDITKINGAEIEIVDVITGGSPCQDLSIAGKRAGLDGARSGLFMEQVRIVKEMREHDRANGRTGDMVRPRFMVWENVPGAFSSNKGQDFAAVLEEIIRIAEPEAPDIEVPEKGWPTWGGYHDEVGGRWSVAWRVHDAQHWGVPQRRRRISVVADFGGDTAGEILFERKSVSMHPAESGTARERLAEASERGFNPAVEDCMTAWDCQSKRIFDTNGKSPTLQGGVGGGVNNPAIFCMATQQGGAELRSDDRSPTLTAAAGMIGNNQPVVCAGFEETPINLMVATRCKALGRGTGFGVGEPGDPAYTISAAHSHGVLCAVNKPAVVAPAAMAFDTTQITSKENRSQPEFGKPCHTLNANAHAPCVALDMTHACDVIRECGEQVPALQARMGTGGNQVPLVADCGFFSCYENISPTLLARTYKEPHIVASTEKTGSICAKSYQRKLANQDIVNGCYPAVNGGNEMVVRRITPMECERLQGFPDGWTDIGEWRDSKGKLRKPSDSPRYKALGNSIALPFWDFLAKRISAQYLRPVTMGSLFDGIGGFPLVFERHNGKGTARWASEIEEFPIAVTKLRFGED